VASSATRRTPEGRWINGYGTCSIHWLSALDAVGRPRYLRGELSGR
jgi:hypothetical protein